MALFPGPPTFVQCPNGKSGSLCKSSGDKDDPTQGSSSTSTDQVQNDGRRMNQQELLSDQVSTVIHSSV